MSEIIKTGMQLKTSTKLEFIASAIMLLIVALAFNALLSLHSLEKLYVESIASQYSAVGKDLQRSLEKSLRFGKNIRKFIGIGKILEGTRQNIVKKISLTTVTGKKNTELPAEKDVSVSIVLPDGSILYSTNAELVGTTLPEQARIDYGDTGKEETASKEYSYIKYQNTYITPLPVRDRRKTWIASALIMFDERQVVNILNNIRNQNIKEISIILACSSILLLIHLARVKSGDLFVSSRKFRVSLGMFVVIISAQFVFSGLNLNAFRKYYLQINKQKTETLTTLLKEDIEFLLSKGIKINKLIKMDVMMGEIIDASPELSDITILDKEDRPLYMATKKGVIDFQKATEEQLKLTQELKTTEIDLNYNIRLDIAKGDQVEGYISANVSKEGSISTNISKEVIFRKLWEIGLDSATILIISILFFVELLILIFHFIEQQIAEIQQHKRIRYGAIRPAAFLFIFGIDISISFLPLHMENLYEPILNLSKDMVMGLPISTEMLFAGIAVLLAGVWVDRRGWHEPFLTGLCLAGMGVLYSWKAPDALHFIISRGIAGFGYGLALIATQGFVVRYSDENRKAQGLAQLFAGVYAGSICGAAVGAMLAERIGYNRVFLLGAVILFSVIWYIIFFMRNAIKKPEKRIVAEQPVQSVSIRQLFRFFFNRNIFSLMLFGIVPSATAVVGFINYFYPIYLNRIGTTQSNIGRVYMLFGLCLIYIAPLTSKYIDTSESKKRYIVVNGVLGSIAFIAFYFSGGFLITAIVVFMLGMSMCFDASRPYALKFKITRELGEGTALGIFFSVEKIGQVVGPMIFGVLFLAVNLNNAIAYFGLGYLIITGLFILFAKSDKKIVQTENQTT